MEGKKRKNDIFLIVGILLASLLLYAGYRLFYGTDGSYVVVTVDGREVACLPLYEKMVFDIPVAEGKNSLRIRDGYAEMMVADCPDQLCVHQRRISKKGETIVCLPHKVVVKVIDGDAAELDGVAS